MSSLVLADPTHALALAIIVCFSTKRLVDLYKIYHENNPMPNICEEDHILPILTLPKGTHFQSTDSRS